MIKVPDTAEGLYKPPNSESNHDYFPQCRCIDDRTIHYENGVPCLFFFLEWMQTFDGTMEFVRISPDSNHEESS